MYKPKSCSFPILPLPTPPLYRHLPNKLPRSYNPLDVKGTTDHPTLAQLNKKPLFPSKKNHDRIIKPSDKGGNIAVMDLKRYQKMVMDILKNHHWYMTLPGFQVERVKTNYANLIAQAFRKGIIDKKIWEFLSVKTPKMPTLYTLPKVHKNMDHLPGWPIVLGNGCIMESASQLLDNYLRP